MACEPPESCIGGRQQSFSSWYFWFCLSLLLLLALLALLGCGLQCWLPRRRPWAAQRSLTVFAVGDPESVPGTDARPWTQPQGLPPCPQIPGWGAQEASWSALAWNGLPPPPYEERAKQGGSSD
ncbi:transmembrane protein 207 [Liasis olivaceus]